jgi:hypothetical protein
MPILGWRVHFTRRQLTMPRTVRLTLHSLPTDVISGWLDREGIEDGVPFLIAPDGHYDVDLNAYFLLHPAPENTLAAIAYDLASFLTFLWHTSNSVASMMSRFRITCSWHCARSKPNTCGSSSCPFPAAATLRARRN